MKNIKYNKEKLKTILKQYALQFIVVHGSQVREEANEKSDLDLAVMVKEDKQMDRNFQFSLIRDLQKCFPHFPEIDVVFLNTASALLKYQVAVEGQMLVEFQMDCFFDFAIRAVKEYEDIRYFDMYLNDVIQDYLEEVE
jgi:predicted nucleotidyltransferase